MPKPYIPNDKWSKRAAAEGYRARSVYKLMELDQRFHLLRPGMSVLDLGAAPGSWLQYVAEVIGDDGWAVGMDLQEMEPVGDRVSLHKMDITDRESVERILKREEMEEVDLVLSDIAPSTSGIKDVDQWKSIELTQAALAIAEVHLRPGGKVAVKVFRGSDFDEFLADVRAHWKNVKVVTVQASRDRSREVYVVGQKG